MKNYKKWIKDFMESWKKLEGEKTCDLLANKLKYFENPIDKPCVTKEQVIPLWSVVKENQKDISYKFDILFEDDKSCVCHWIMTRTMVKTNEKQNIDGIFEIKLDKNGLCNYFKQWRFTRVS